MVSYGSAVFEGIRCYDTKEGPAIFRLRDHVQRLLNSAYIYRMEVPFTLEELCAANLDLIRVNKIGACYLRPIVLRGYGEAGVDPKGCPIEVYLSCYEWGKYLGEEGLRNGVDVCISSWNRPAPNTLPQMAKAAANYMNSQLIRMEARANGYVEGIALDVHGHISEGSGENIFLVMDGTVITPPLSNSALPGITRHSVLTICRDLNIPGGRAGHPARNALHLRRDFLLRHCSGDHSDPLGRPHQDWDWLARPHYQAHSGRIFRPHRRRQTRPPSLALANKRSGDGRSGRSSARATVAPSESN